MPTNMLAQKQTFTVKGFSKKSMRLAFIIFKLQIALKTEEQILKVRQFGVQFY